MKEYHQPSLPALPSLWSNHYLGQCSAAAWLQQLYCRMSGGILTMMVTTPGCSGCPGWCSPLTGCESVGARLWYVLSAAPGGPDRHSLLIPADQLSVTQRAASRPRSRITGHRSVPPTQAFLMNTFLLSAFLYFTNMPIFTFSWQTSASIFERKRSRI